MRYFPIFLDLKDKPILVVGGGEVACRKVDMLVRAGARVTVISPQLHSHLQELMEQQQIYCLIKSYQSSDVLEQDFIQVWATTDNPELNHQVHQDAKQAKIMVNVVDDTPYCDFITPSMINRGRIQVAISSGGASPVLIRFLREKLETILPQNLSLLAEFGAQKRDDIKRVFPSVDHRRKFWEKFLRLDKVEKSQFINELESLYQECVEQKIEITGSLNWVEYSDDVENLSLKALRTMQATELVLYPADCPFEFVDLCRRDAERTCYQSADNLVELIKQAQDEQLRVCVLVSKRSLSTEIETLVDKNHYLPIVG